MSSSRVMARTQPPLRLRMVSSDILCARSMEIQWDDGTGMRQRWSSWSDELEGRWYEAEKILSSSVTDIRVTFKVRVPGGDWDVCRVDRQNNCSWVLGDGRKLREELWFRDGQHDVSHALDAVFELRGPPNACYVWRTWNAARELARYPADWECWQDIQSRPVSEAYPPTLDAADGAAPLAPGLGNPDVYLICTTKRMCAAARELLEIHGQTLEELKEIDSQFSEQWLAANMGNTTTAGLGIASAVLLFVAPAVGIGLGISSAVTGTMTFAGDSIASSANFSSLRQQLYIDSWNAFVVAELIKEWNFARQAMGSKTNISRSASVSCNEKIVRSPIDAGLTVGAVTDSVAMTATRMATDTMPAAAAAASQVLGVAGALISTGVAIRSWSTLKPGQSTTRRKITELMLRVLQLQHLLAAMNQLECSICCEGITLADDVRRCLSRFHCFHARCLRRRRKEAEEACPLCCYYLERGEEMMLDSLNTCQRAFQRAQRGLTPCSSPSRGRQRMRALTA